MSSESAWLPQIFRDMFVRGICGRNRWTTYYAFNDEALLEHLHDTERSDFRLTDSAMSALCEMTQTAVTRLKLVGDSKGIAKKLLACGLITQWLFA